MNHWQDRYLDARKEKREAPANKANEIDKKLLNIRNISAQIGEFLKLIKTKKFISYQDFSRNNFEAFFHRFNVQENHSKIAGLTLGTGALAGGLMANSNLGASNVVDTPPPSSPPPPPIIETPEVIENKQPKIIEVPKEPTVPPVVQPREPIVETSKIIEPVQPSEPIKPIEVPADPIEPVKPVLEPIQNNVPVVNNPIDEVELSLIHISSPRDKRQSRMPSSA